MLNVYDGVNKPLADIGEEKPLNLMPSSPYTKPSLMHRLSNREQETVFPSHSDFTSKCSTKLIDRLSELTDEGLSPLAGLCPKRSWEEVTEPMKMKEFKKRRLLDRISPRTRPQTRKVTDPEEQSGLESISTFHVFPGVDVGKPKLPLYQRISKRPLTKSSYIREIPNVSSNTSSQLQVVPLSLQANGSTSFNGNMLILPRSLNQPIRRSSIQNKPTSLMTRLSSPSASQSQQEPLGQRRITTQPLPCSSRRSPSSFLNDGMSTPSISHISDVSSTQLNHHSMGESLTMIEPFAIECRSNDIFASLILPTSMTSAPHSCPLMESVPVPPNSRLLCGPQLNKDLLVSGVSPAINGTEGFVRNLTQTVSMPTVVTEEDVGEIIKDPNVARRGKLDNQVIAQGQRFRRKYIWGHDRSVVSRTALWTETAQPLPSPPLNEFDNQDALHTISTHSHLFKIVTPINVDRFESLLRDHPNPDFVHSVCLGLRQGFWPFAHTHYGEWPILWDNSHRPLKSEEEVIFVKEQVEKEVTKGRFSEAFGPDLLPGMYSMPVHAVPKPGVKKFRLVTDHSAGTTSGTTSR